MDNVDVVEYGNSIFFPFKIAFPNLIMPFHVFWVVPHLFIGNTQ